jgi:hypothetical protein
MEELGIRVDNKILRVLYRSIVVWGSLSRTNMDIGFYPETGNGITGAARSRASDGRVDSSMAAQTRPEPRYTPISLFPTQQQRKVNPASTYDGQETRPNGSLLRAKMAHIHAKTHRQRKCRTRCAWIRGWQWQWHAAERQLQFNGVVFLVGIQQLCCLLYSWVVRTDGTVSVDWSVAV